MNANSKEIYVSVDIEAAGPIPGEYSMLSFGACIVGIPTKSFYVELKPVNENSVRAALEVSKFDLNELKLKGVEPAAAMRNFESWILEACAGGTPVFVGFNATFDWAFINWYFHKFLQKNPFGIGGIDIKAYYMGYAGVDWDKTRSSQLPKDVKVESKLTHNALEDAKSQAEMFQRILEASRAKRKT
jgi:ribonuclease T